MSREIIYDKQFIKVADRFIPMILSGSNNCYEWGNGRERRARSWFPMNSDAGLMPTKKQILTDAENLNKSNYGRYGSDNEYNENKFLSYLAWEIGQRYSFSQYKSWLKTAMKKAITLEQLEELGNGITLVAQHRYDDSETVKNGYKPFTLKTLNDKELLKAYEDAKDNYGYITFRFDWRSEGLGTRARKRYFPRAKKNENKELQEVDHYYTISIKELGYLYEHTRRGTKYVSTPYKKYATKKEAERVAKRYNKKYRHTYEVERVDRKTNVYV